MLNKQEKARLTEIESVYWRDDHMVKHCVNRASFLHNLRGKIVVVEKQSIKTDFCFGYSLSRYDSESYDNANEMARYAAENQRYFIKENHRNANYASTISMLNSERWKAYARPHYCGNCPDLYSIGFCRDWEDIPKDAFVLTDAEKSEYKLTLARACKEHHKKIMAYLKRYGMEKVNTWSYWRDE